MESDAIRTRVDQFYASRKRKTRSPALKSGMKIEKDTRTAAEGSPSAKGNLSTSLVSSQEAPNAVKRNLVSDIIRICNDGKEVEEEQSSLHPGTSEAVRKEKSQGSSSNAGYIVAQGIAKCKPVLGCSAENSELKQFANDFLSLYCSELQSTATSPLKQKFNGHKRQGSPLLIDSAIKNSVKRHCLANQLESEMDPACSTEMAEDKQSAIVVKTAASFINASREVFGGSNLGQLQGSLRKCSKGSKSDAKMTDCSTPGSVTGRAVVCGTPKSVRGSSMFSPGEAFWNEAIQVVDGLFVNNDDLVAQAAEEVNNRNHGDNPKQTECSASMELIGKHMKSSIEEVSPLPVKHLDFLSEDKKMSASTTEAKLKITGGGEASEHGSVNLTGSQAVNVEICRSENETDKEMCDVNKTNSFRVIDEKVEFANEDTDSILSTSLVNELGTSRVNNEYVEAETPPSSMAFKDRLDLSDWLPPEVCGIYGQKGILKLYPWQVDCLQVDGVLQRRNLVYCASTSAGKSFVAEILMLRQVISTGKIALLVLPYVSICAEKAEHLEGLLEPLGKHVRSYYGNQGGGTLPKDTSVAVCTIEKANILINRLLEEARLSEIGIIVIDELHMVGDQSRGYLLELMLTKLRYASGEGNLESSSGESSSSSSKGDPAHGLQIVGMSATMPNVAAVADWLQAALYQTDFRPVPLEEYIKVGNTIYDRKMDIIRTIPKSSDLGGKDPDHIVELCNEIVQEGHSVLIFCSSRKGCESTARHVSRFLKKFSVYLQNDSEFADITSAIETLRKSPVGLDATLEETLPSGVAYHHAGLTVEEREIIEICYRRGLVRVLTATSTLAAGVNLPARRVIFRQPRIGLDFIDGTRYRQMAGRAGRTGIDRRGESVLICKPEELKRIMGVLNESCPPLQSCLSEDKNGMTHAILEVVAGGIVQTAGDIHRYVRCTLLNSTKPFGDVVNSAQDSLRWLCHGKFLEWDEDAKLYGTTPLGRAAFGSSLSPEESLIVLDDLSRAREGFVLASDLHLVYLVTPINVEVEPDWELYYERFMELSTLDQSVGNRVGVSEPFLMCMAHGAPMRPLKRSVADKKGMGGKFRNHSGTSHKNMTSDEHTLRVCKRFYVALILARLVQETPVVEVCEAFKVARGMVQALQESAGRFASMVSVFCERLGWLDLEGLVAKFQNRVSFGVRAEIVELTTIPYVKGSRARSLYKAGLRTPIAIAEASIPEIAKALFDSSSWASQEGSAQRRIQLGVVKKIKNGARKIVLDKAEEAKVAAFSAFKSLGFSVPQCSPPLMRRLSENVAWEGARRTLSGDHTNNVFHCIDQRGCASGHLSSEDVNLSKVALGNEGELMKPLDVGLVAPAELNSTGFLRCRSGSKSALVQAANSLTLGSEIDAAACYDNNSNAIPCIQLEQNAVGNQKNDSSREKFCGGNKDVAFEKGPVNASNVSGGLDSFLDLWEKTQEFCFDIHFNKRSYISSVAPFEIRGIAVCWDNSPVYYINLPKDLLKNDHLSISASVEKGHSLAPDNLLEIMRHRWNQIGEIMGKKDVKKFTWNLKVQIQVLKNSVVSVQRFGCTNLFGDDGSCLSLSPIHVRAGIDMCIVAWILSPDEGKSSNPKLEKEVKKRLSVEAIAAADCCGRWKNQMRRAAHNGCCRRVAQVRALHSVLWKLLISEELVGVLEDIEIPVVNVLADMEFWGIGIDMEGCLHARNVLGKKLRLLERKAYELAGMTFSLYTTADIANVLYKHLKLPIPEGHDKGKQHPSTDKHCLDLLRHEHPIIPVIREHRTLAKLLNCTLGSICSLARLSMKTQKYTLHGHWLQTSTATGRLSMEEPNLQCVEHMVEFQMSVDENGGDADTDHLYKINAREFFVPTQENWLLLTADYSQIELRLMAHFSKDASLVELLSKPHGDIFTVIATRWTGKPEDAISVGERDQTKRLVYGILYGMGANTLAEQLDCSSDEAAEKIKSFKSSFPGVASWLHEAVACCHRKGYVETLKGRKRFLSKITLGNSKEKSKAQRQAVNSICQGSAADVIKIAMINLYSVIANGFGLEPGSSIASKFSMLKSRCRILLQVHDELVMEVDASVVKEAALLLKVSMESAASLLVPLQVKLKIGRTWGSLEPFQVDQCADNFLGN